MPVRISKSIESCPKAPSRGFSLVEMTFAVAIFAMISLVLFTFLEMGLRIYAKTLSVSLTEWQARKSLATVMLELQEASGPPTFLDQNGNDVTNSTAAGLGVRYQTWSTSSYNTRDSAALIVVSGSELRHYSSGFTTNRLNGTYKVLSRSIVAPTTVATGTAMLKENYPFHLTSFPASDARAPGRLLDVNLKVMARDYNRFLSMRRHGGMHDEQTPNTFIQVRGMVGYRFDDTALVVTST
jgi:prepilin-type N-terminal cleavage/methylation domain-containing protein